MVIVHMMGSYFDMYEFEANPIKTLIRSYIYNLDHRIAQGSNFYVKRMKAETRDSWIGKFMEL